ncbi:unnamed protein product [Rotaria sp. Silwood2]|nr:unnamed protein product [Rotaria sp. Silwood2]
MNNNDNNNDDSNFLHDFKRRGPSNEYEQQVLKRTNKARTQGHFCGSTWYPATTELTWNDELADTAQGHADSMHDNDYFSHTEIISSYNLIIETKHTLDLREDESISEGENENTSEGEDDDTSVSEDDFEYCKHSDKCKYSYEQMQKIADKSEKLSFNSLKYHYKKLKNPVEVSRIRKYIANGGTDFQKYELIKDFVI